MVKTTIDINTKVKVKNIEVEEYEKIMNVWRACMLFFEREMRRLHDKNEISNETLMKVANNIDFTELLRINFLSIKDQERMRLVKLTEVAEAIQKVQQMPIPQYSEPNVIQPIDNNITENFPPDFENSNEVYQEVINPISSILQQESVVEGENTPEIHAKDHLKILQRNTASSVVELRKLMYQNIQKIRQALTDEST